MFLTILLFLRRPFGVRVLQRARKCFKHLRETNVLWLREERVEKNVVLQKIGIMALFSPHAANQSFWWPVQVFLHTEKERPSTWKAIV